MQTQLKLARAVEFSAPMRTMAKQEGLAAETIVRLIFHR